MEVAFEYGWQWGPDPRSPMENSSIRGCNWVDFAPHGGLNGQNSSPSGEAGAGAFPGSPSPSPSGIPDFMCVH